jgi:NAD dependent epimerase/dehydratase family enzyme
MRLVLGGMGDLVLEGRPAQPQRLLEAGFQFQHPTLQSALDDLYS